MTDIIDLDTSSPMKPTKKAATAGTSSSDELLGSPTTPSKAGLSRAKRPAPVSKSSPKAKKQVSNSLGDEFDLDMSLSSDDDIGTFKKPIPKPKSKPWRSTGPIAEPKKITKVHGGIAKSLSMFIMGPNFKMPEPKEPTPEPTPEPKPAEKAKSLPTPTSSKAAPKSAKTEPMAASSKATSSAPTRPVSFSVNKGKVQKKPASVSEPVREKGRTKAEIIARVSSKEETMKRMKAAQQDAQRRRPTQTPAAAGQSAKPSSSTARPASRPASVAQPPAVKTPAARTPATATQRAPTTQKTPTQRPAQAILTSQAQKQNVDAKEKARIAADTQIQWQLKSLLTKEQWAQHQANLRKAKADMEKKYGSSNVVILDSPPRASGSSASSSRAPTPQTATPNTAPRSGPTCYAGTAVPYHVSPASPHTPVHTTCYGIGAPGYCPPPVWSPPPGYQGNFPSAVKAHPFPGYCGNTPTDQHRPQSMSPTTHPHSPYGQSSIAHSAVPHMQARAPQNPSPTPRVQVPATQSSPVIILDSPPLKSAPFPPRSQQTTPTPTEKPEEKSAENPAEKVAEKAEEPEKDSTEKPAEKPAEKFAEASTEKSTEKPSEESSAPIDAAPASASSPVVSSPVAVTASSPSVALPTEASSPAVTAPVASSPDATDESVSATSPTADKQVASSLVYSTPVASLSLVAESTALASSSVPAASSPVSPSSPMVAAAAPASPPPVTSSSPFGPLSPVAVATAAPASPPPVTSSSPFGPLSPVAAAPAPASPALPSSPFIPVSPVHDVSQASSPSPFPSVSPDIESPVALSPAADEPLSPVRADSPVADSPIEISSPVDLSSPEPVSSARTLLRKFLLAPEPPAKPTPSVNRRQQAMPKFVVAGAPSVPAPKTTANKKELKDANKKRSSHRDTKHELTTFLDERLKQNKKLFQALETQRKELDVPAFKYHSPPLVPGCDYSQIVYDRHYTCVYNQENDVYYPVAPGTRREDFAVVVFTAKELMRVAELENGMETLSQIRRSSTLSECKSVVLLTQGLEKALTSLLHAVESDKHKKQQAEITATAYTSKKDLSGNEGKVHRVRHFVNTLYLTQLFKPVDFNTDKELAEYICQMHLGRSLQPYRQKLELYSSETKSYKTRKECLRSMMEQQKRVNLQAAKNISDQYESVQALAKAFDEKGPKLLVGTVSTAAKTMGAITSDYIYQLFTCKDPNKEIFSQL